MNKAFSLYKWIESEDLRGAQTCGARSFCGLWNKKTPPNLSKPFERGIHLSSARRLDQGADLVPRQRHAVEVRQAIPALDFLDAEPDLLGGLACEKPRLQVVLGYGSKQNHQETACVAMVSVTRRPVWGTYF